MTAKLHLGEGSAGRPSSGDYDVEFLATRMERDCADARTLNVTKTPEYFVNGRPMPRFGLEELQALVREELRNACR